MAQKAQACCRQYPSGANLRASHFSFLSVPGLLFSLWVLAHSLARLLSGEVTPQRPGQPLLALLWYFQLMGGLWSWAICPSVGQACEKECDVVPFPKVEAGAGVSGALGLEEPPHPSLRATEFIGSPPPAPGALNLRKGGNPIISPHGWPPPQGSFLRTLERAGLQAWSGLDSVGLKLEQKALTFGLGSRLSELVDRSHFQSEPEA